MLSLTALRRGQGLGYRPDWQDGRDLLIGSAGLPTTPPPNYPPHHGLTPLYQEGNSCTGRIVHAFRIGEVNHGRPCPELSGRHNYYVSRFLWGGHLRDGGSYIREAVKALVQEGAATAKLCPETMWKVQLPPSAFAARSAYKLRGLRGYYRIDPSNHTEMRQVLASGYAIKGGWRVNKAFLDKTGPKVVDAIRDADLSLGHAWVIDGYQGDLYHMVNSWRGWRGTEFVSSGCWMTPEFVAQALDAWAIIVDYEAQRAA